MSRRTCARSATVLCTYSNRAFRWHLATLDWFSFPQWISSYILSDAGARSLAPLLCATRPRPKFVVWADRMPCPQKTANILMPSCCARSLSSSAATWALTHDTCSSDVLPPEPPFLCTHLGQTSHAAFTSCALLTPPAQPRLSRHCVRRCPAPDHVGYCRPNGAVVPPSSGVGGVESALELWRLPHGKRARLGTWAVFVAGHMLLSADWKKSKRESRVPQ